MHVHWMELPSACTGNYIQFNLNVHKISQPSFHPSIHLSHKNTHTHTHKVFQSLSFYCQCVIVFCSKLCALNACRDGCSNETRERESEREKNWNFIKCCDVSIYMRRNKKRHSEREGDTITSSEQEEISLYFFSPRNRIARVVAKCILIKCNLKKCWVEERVLEGILD